MDTEKDLRHIYKNCAAYIQDAELCRSQNGCYNPKPEDFCSYFDAHEILDRYGERT